MKEKVLKRLIGVGLVLAMVITLVPLPVMMVYADTPTVSMTDLSLDTDEKILNTKGDFCVDFNFTIINPDGYRDFYIDLYYVLKEGDEEVCNGVRGFFASDLKGSDEIELSEVLPETEYTLIIEKIDVQGFPDVPEGEVSDAEYVLILDADLPVLSFTTPEVSFSSSSVTYDESTNTITFDGTEELTNYEVNEGLNLYPSATKAIITGYTSIGCYAFYGNSNLTSITIPDGLTAIGANAFSNSDIENITIPNSVSTIDEEAFGYCIYLKSITIPDSVFSIGSQAFTCCTGLSMVIFEGTVGANGFGVIDDAFYGVGVEGGTSNPAITFPDAWTENRQDSITGEFKGGYFVVPKSDDKQDGNLETGDNSKKEDKNANLTNKDKTESVNSSPETGDRRNVYVWLLTMIAGLGLALYCGKRCNFLIR